MGKPYSFGERSRRELASCHETLQKLAHIAIQHVDFSVIEGHRSLERQAQLYKDGKSQLLKGMHNHTPSLAFDLLPYPSTLEGVSIWDDIPRYQHFCGFIRGVAVQSGIAIRCGADWDGDFNHREHSFLDLPHFELVGVI